MLSWHLCNAHSRKLGIDDSIHWSERRDLRSDGSVLFPRSKILTLVPIIIFFFTVRLPAALILGYWFLIQFLSTFLSLGDVDQTGVGWWAHVGGFILGVLLAGGF